jgi:hypothetical protein
MGYTPYDMRRIALRVYSVVSVVVLIGLLVWLGVRLYRARDANLEQSASRFESVRSSAEAAFLAGGGFESDFFRRRMRSRFEEQPNLRALVFYAHDTGIQYFLARAASYLDPPLREDPDWTGTPDYSYDGLRHQLFRAHLNLSQTGGIAMDGIYGVLPSSIVFPAVRDALFGLLVLLFLTGIALGLLSVVPAPSSAPSPGTEAAAADGQAEPTAGDESTGEAGNGAEQAAADAEDATQSVGPEAGDEGGTDGAKRAAARARQEREEQERPGLFSPRSGLGRPEYFPKRLSFELERAASFSQDLSVVILSSESMARDDELYAKVAKAIVGTFTFQDLAFEYGPSAFCIILPNTSLKQALSQMDSFVKGLEVKYATKAGVRFSVGISSRNKRSVSSSRLHSEVKAAWKKAEAEEGSQIIAFRSDPDKFREYLSSTV